MLTIRKQLAVSIGCVVVLIVCAGVGMMATAQTLSATAVHTDLSGRQRALSQRAAKEALLFSRSPSDESRAALLTTVHVFSVSLDAMLHGGLVPRNADGTDRFLIQPVEDEEAWQHGLRQQQLWLPLQIAAKQLVAAQGTDTEALEVIVAGNAAVFGAANKMTQRLAQSTDERATWIMGIEALTLFLSLLAGCIALWVGGRIGSAIERLTEHADRISLGESQLPVPSHGPGEIGVLGKSLDRMRLSLNKSIALLAEDKVTS